MGGNPNLAALLSNPAAAAMLLAAIAPKAAAPVPAAPPAPPAAYESTMVDPDVMELCDHFQIEDRHAKRLDGLMKKRQDTFVEDLERLYDVLERAREPAGLLTVKMREMEEGTFMGKQKPDETLKAMSKKFKLDEQAELKLADILARHDADRKAEIYKEVDKHLETSNRPSAMVMMLLRKLGDGSPLGRPGPVAIGSYLDRKKREEKEGSGGGGDRRDKDKDKDRDRDRDRDSDRDRDRDRDKDKDKDKDRKRSRSRRR